MSAVRKLLVLTALALSVLVFPSVASATTGISRTGKVILVSNDDNSAVNITAVSENAGTVSFVGTTLSPGSNCTGTAVLVSCASVPLPLKITSGQTTNIGSGWQGSNNDTFNASGITNPQISVDIEFSNGTDTFTGGSGPDKFGLLGTTTTVNSGPGDDYIDAVDDFQNLAGQLNCGTGTDWIERDSDDLAPSGFTGCERAVAQPTSFGDAALPTNPRAGQIVDSASLVFANIDGPLTVFAPRNYDGDPNGWFLCNTPIAAVDADAVPTGACTLIGSSRLVTVPGTATGKYLAFGAFSGGLAGPGSPSGPDDPLGPGSITINGHTGPVVGNGQLILPALPVPVPVNDFTGALSIKCKSTSCSLSLLAPGPGTFTVEQSGNATIAKKKKKKKSKIVTKTTTTAKAAGTVKVPIKLTSAAKKALKRKKKLTAKIKVTFTPTGGTAASKTGKASYKLKKKKKKKK